MKCPPLHVFFFVGDWFLFMATILQLKVAKRRLLEKVSLERCQGFVETAVCYDSARSMIFKSKRRYEKIRFFKWWVKKCTGHGSKITCAASILLILTFVWWRSHRRCRQGLLKPPEAPSILRRRNLRTEVLFWKRIKYFPSSLPRRNFNTQQSPVILNSIATTQDKNSTYTWRSQRRCSRTCTLEQSSKCN